MPQETAPHTEENQHPMEIVTQEEQEHQQQQSSLKTEGEDSIFHKQEEHLKVFHEQERKEDNDTLREVIDTIINRGVFWYIYI